MSQPKKQLLLIALGGAVGLFMALRVAMTAMPQLVSLFNAVGGGAAAIVALFDYGHVVGTPEEGISTAIFVVLGVVIGSITFAGSLIASGKLQGLISGKPIRVPGGTLTTAILGIVALAGTLLLVFSALVLIATYALRRAPLSVWPRA